MCDPACIEFGVKNLFVSEIQNKDVIEVGSYNINGSLRSDILKLHPKKYIGVDIVAGPGVDEVCSAYDIIDKYSKESFDVVISTEMLEHVEDWKKVISHFKNILRLNGVVIITTRSKGFGKHNHPYDYWRFEVYSINS